MSFKINGNNPTDGYNPQTEPRDQIPTHKEIQTQRTAVQSALKMRKLMAQHLDNHPRHN